MNADPVGAGRGGGDVLLRLEIDEVEVTGGRLFGPADEILASLLGGLRELLDGSRTELDVSFSDGAYELAIGAAGKDALISLASLRRPAGVVFRDLRVDLDELVEAALACADERLAGLAAAGGAEHPAAARRLRGSARRLARLRGGRSTARAEGSASPGDGAAPSPRSSPPGGGLTFGFDQHDPDGRIRAYRTGAGLHALLAPGHVYVHGPDGEELAVASGAPFLILRELSDVAARMLEAQRSGASSYVLPFEAPLEVDLAGGAVTIAGRTLRCAADAVARAIFSALLDFAGVIRARNPRLAASAHLSGAVQDARMRLALCDERRAGAVRVAHPAPPLAGAPRREPVEPPIAPGALRRIALREAWRRELPRIDAFRVWGEHAWIAHEGGATRISLRDGTISARVVVGPAGELVAAGAIAFALDGGALSRFDPDGALVWRRSVDADRLEAAWTPPRSPLAWLKVGGADFVAVDAKTGAEAFRFSPPAARSCVEATSGGLLVVASDNGMAYGLDARAGAIVWRAPLEREPSALAIAGRRLVCAGREGGRVILDGLDAATGEGSFCVETSLSRVGALLADARGVVAAGMGASVPEVVRIDADGRVRWIARPNLGAGSPRIARTGGALFARGSEGVARIDRGKVRWNAPCGPGGVPVVTRGVAVLPGAETGLLDAATGRPVESAARLPPADHLAVGGTGVLVLADADGTCVGLRPSGALAVVV